MKVQELIAQLHKFPPDTNVEIYAGKCCHLQPINPVFLHQGGAEDPSVMLVDETQEPCTPSRCNGCPTE